MKAKILLALMSLLLVSCDDSEELINQQEDEIYRLKSQVEDLEEKIDDIQSEFHEVTGALLNLGNEIEDFSSENWRDNVPDVEYHFEQLKVAVSGLDDEF